MARRKRRVRSGDLSSRGAQARQLNRVYEKYSGICQLCFNHCSRSEASRDHVLEVCLGGSSEDSNVVLAHKSCNEEKSRDLGKSLNRQSPLPSVATELPDDWWNRTIRKQIWQTVNRQLAGLSPTSGINKRLSEDKDFFSYLPIKEV